MCESSNLPSTNLRVLPERYFSLWGWPRLYWNLKVLSFYWNLEVLSFSLFNIKMTVLWYHLQTPTESESLRCFLNHSECHQAAATFVPTYKSYRVDFRQALSMVEFFEISVVIPTWDTDLTWQLQQLCPQCTYITWLNTFQEHSDNVMKEPGYISSYKIF